jgi:hypothetical protein
MVEVTQYSFNWAELAEMLIKKQNIHEGQWMATVEFAISSGAFGVAGPADAKPGVMLLANGVQLIRAQPNFPQHLVVDAAKVNPIT